LKGIKMALRANDRASWLNTIWEAIHELEACEPNADMDDVKTAMAWVTETLGLELDSNGDFVPLDTNESALKALGFELEQGGGGCAVLSIDMENGAFVWATCLDGGGLPENDNWMVCAYGDDIGDIIFELRSDQNDSGLSLDQAAALAINAANDFEPTPCTNWHRHRDSGRGVCIDCGAAL
jgi:hypothetical protein